MKKRVKKGVCFLFLHRKSLTGICQRSRIAHWNGECFVSLHILFYYYPPTERFLILQSGKTVSHRDVPLIFKKKKKMFQIFPYTTHLILLQLSLTRRVSPSLSFAFSPCKYLSACWLSNPFQKLYCDGETKWPSCNSKPIQLSLRCSLLYKALTIRTIVFLPSRLTKALYLNHPTDLPAHLLGFQHVKL